VLNETEILDPRIIEAETLGAIYKAHVQVYRHEKNLRKARGEEIDENMIVNPQIMSIKRNSMHPWQCRSPSHRLKKTSSSSSKNASSRSSSSTKSAQ